MKLCEPKKPKQGVCTQRPYSVCSNSDIPCSSRVGTMIFLLRALCYCAVLLRVCVCVRVCRVCVCGLLVAVSNVLLQCRIHPIERASLWLSNCPTLLVDRLTYASYTKTHKLFIKQALLKVGKMMM